MSTPHPNPNVPYSIVEKEETMDTNQPYPITLPELFLYLSDFTPAACDFCGKSSWTVILNNFQQISVISGNENQIFLERYENQKKKKWRWRPIDSTGERVFQLRCKNCGQIKYFSYDEVLRKIENTRNENLKNEEK